MEILLQSDGQLYPPKPVVEKKPISPMAPPPAASPPARHLPLEELLILGVALIILKSSDRLDLPLLLALAYIFFDHSFSLKGLL